MERDQDLEERTIQTGRAIFKSMEGKVPSVFDRKRWKGKVMEWAMNDEAFRIRLFRFIDLLPSLKTDAAVASMLSEYFSDIDTPRIIRWTLKGLSRGTGLSKVTGMAIRANVESLARQFIAGTGPEEAISTTSSLWNGGFASTIDLLGEATLSEKEAGDYLDRYLTMIDLFHPRISEWPDGAILESDEKGPIPRLNISLKVSSFYSRLDPADWEESIASVIEALRPIFRKARALPLAITFDMEHYYYKNLTIAIFRRILEEEEFKDFPFAGIAIQAYLKDSRKDLAGLIDWAKKKRKSITVRLVKGAYWDYEVAVNRQKGWPIPVLTTKEETDRNYEELSGLLLENTGYIRAAIASHNIRSISKAMAAGEKLGLAKEAIEFQALYGMAEYIQKAVKERGYRVRVYTPVGELIPGMAYLVRRLLENTSNESFLRRSFMENRSFEELIKKPIPRERDTKKQRPRENGFQNEPLLDFSMAAVRDRMEGALKKTRKHLGKRYPLLLGDEECMRDVEIRSLNPARPGETIGTVSAASIEDADRAVETAMEVWKEWRWSSPEKRAEYLFKAAGEARKRRYELTAIEMYETGKNRSEADADIAEAIDYFEYYAREGMRLGRPRRLGSCPGEANEYLYIPKGVGVVISPWNFPLAIPAGMVSAGLVTGNCIILKPSGLSPVTAWRLIELLRNGGIPPGVLQFLPGPGAGIGEHLVSHPGVDFIAFTGSREVGLRIVDLASSTAPGQSNVKRVITEMGGKNAIIVDETADLDEAVKGVMESALGYQGQKCSACSRVIVIGSAYEEFCERLRYAVESVKIGPPEDPGSFMGPLIDERALKKTEGYIERGRRDGRPLLIRKAERGGGYFAGPAIFLDVQEGSPVVRDEIFGPVLVVIRAGNLEEAVRIANDTDYALTGGLFSRSPVNIGKVRESFDVGNLYINRKISGALVSRQPFGGFRMSGVGSKAGGPDYLLQFTHPKTVTENTMRRGFAPEI